jgi:hypothetical protein
MAEIEFPSGLIVKPPNERAPDFVRGAISIKRDELIAWLQGRDGEWINLDVCEAKSGKWYCKVNDYKPKPKEGPKPYAAPNRPAAPADPFEDSEIPFLSGEQTWHTK